MLDTSKPYPSVAAIGSFIATLPNHYRCFAELIKLTGADPEALLSLKASQLQTLWQADGLSSLTNDIAQIPVGEDVPPLFFLYINGWREKCLKRNKLHGNDRPSEAFLDDKARPISIQMAEKAFLTLSEKLSLPTPILPSTIQDVAINEFSWSIGSSLFYASKRG